MKRFPNTPQDKRKPEICTTKDTLKSTRRRRRHPLFGAMKGMITIAPGVDLTEPAMPEWADMIDKKYGPDS